jgi:hypothetical protein
MPKRAAFLGDDPEVVQMPVAEGRAHVQVLRERRSLIFCFFLSHCGPIFRLPCNLLEPAMQVLFESRDPEGARRASAFERRRGRA